MSGRSHILIFSIIYALAAFVVIYVMTSGGLGVSYDSENYLVTAGRFTQQEWSRAFNPIWPPLYPLAISGFKVLGAVELLGATRMVSIVSYLVLIVVIFLLGLQLQGRLTAHLAAVSALVLAPLTYVYCFCWSETLYTMLALLFFLMLTSFLKEMKQDRTKYLVWAAVFAGLATVTRFVGFSLIGAGVLSILLFGGYHTGSRKFKKTALFVLVALTPILLHYLVCFFHYGLAGKTQFPSKYSFWQQLVLLFSTLYHDFLSFDLGFWNYVFFFRLGALAFLLRVIFLAGLLVLLVIFFRSLRSRESSGSSFKPHMVVLFYLILYGSIILYVGTAVAIDPIGSRFTVPLYPLILLLVISLISHLYRSLAQGKTGKLALVLVALCAASFWGTQIVSSLSIYAGVSSGSFPAMEHPGNQNRESLRFLKAEADSGDIIVTNIPRKLSFIWPRQIPYADIQKENWEAVQKDMTYEASRRSIYVLLCTEDFSPLGITLEEIENSDLFSRRKEFGNDVVFRSKRVVFRRPDEPSKGE